MTRPIAIGVGCRRGCPAEALLAVIREACAAVDLDGAGLFTVEAKRHEPGLDQAAARLGLTLTFLPLEALAAVADRVTHRSPRVESRLGVPSVAEAAALAGAGPAARLIVPRLALGSATCAVAAGPEIRA